MPKVLNHQNSGRRQPTADGQQPSVDGGRPTALRRRRTADGRQPSADGGRAENTSRERDLTSSPRPSTTRYARSPPSCSMLYIHILSPRSLSELAYHLAPRHPPDGRFVAHTGGRRRESRQVSGVSRVLKQLLLEIKVLLRNAGRRLRRCGALVADLYGRRRARPSAATAQIQRSCTERRRKLCHFGAGSSTIRRWGTCTCPRLLVEPRQSGQSMTPR